MNLPTLLVCIVLFAGFVFALRKIIRDKKAGKSSCGFSCSGCPMSGSCQKKPKTDAGSGSVHHNE